VARIASWAEELARTRVSQSGARWPKERTFSRSGGYDSRADSLAHIHHVRDNIGVFLAEMLRRGQVHDASKFSDEEKPALDEALPLLEGVAYGSPAWNLVVDRVAPALEHHYRHNSHHPEHYGNQGVAGMDLFDVVEMVCDWMAAARRNPTDGVKVELNVQKFAIEPQLAAIIANSLARWPEQTAATA
jgi:Family of unknown function (DUF5662)